VCKGRVALDLSPRQAEGGRDQPGAVTTLGGQAPGPALGKLETLGRRGGVPSVDRQCRLGEHDLGAVVVHRGRDSQRRHGVVAGGGELRPMPDQHLRRVLRILAAEGVPQRLPRHAVRGEPAGGPAMQVRDGLGAAPVQLPAQHVAEEAEEAVRRRRRLPRDREGVPALEVGQCLFPVVASGQRVDQPATQAIRDRGAQQRLLDLRRLPDQHLVDQIVGDRGLLPPDLVDRMDGDGPRAHPARGEA
jgi:hypothetical protein